MYESLLYLSALGALLTVANCDFACFFDKQQNIEDGIDSFFDDDANCTTAVHKILVQLQQAIKDCSVPVSTDETEAMFEEMCDPTSELFKGVSKNAMCLAITTKNKGECLPKEGDVDPYLSVKKSCQKMKDQYFTCLSDIVGKPCGEDAFKAMTRIHQTRKTLTEGMCDDIARIVDHKSSRYPQESYSWMYWIFGVAVILSIILTVLKKTVARNLIEDRKPFISV